MSSVVLQVGQCGNQIGNEFWKIICKNAHKRPGHIYTHADGYLRSVNVDSEPKVLYRVAQASQLKIREENICKGRRGRGTNWALGYHGTKDSEEDQLLEEALDAVRKETERCSSFSGIMLMHSISGGTGSGLGSRLCECLRDDYPLAHLLSAVVAPHAGGESPLQHYNALLCLATLQRYSDSILWFHNDEILTRLQKRSTSDPDVSVSFTAMNEHIARCVAGIVLPTDTLSPHRSVSIGQEPWEMIRSVTPMPATKFVHVNHISKSKYSWENLTGLLTQSHQKYSPEGKPYQSISSLLVARGDSPQMFARSWKKIEAKIKSAYNPVQWNPFPIDYWTDHMNFIGNKDSSSITVASNQDSVGDHLRVIVQGARLKYEAGAYLHWYSKFGCQQTDFEEAFDTVEEVISNYSEATR